MDGKVIPVRVDPSINPHIVRSGITLEPEHPLYNEKCAVCTKPLAGFLVALVFVGRIPGSGWNATAVAVHDWCAGLWV